MPIASTGSVRVHYKVDGAGPGLMLVPGTGADSEVTWGHLVDRFTDRHTVLRPDYALGDEAAGDGGELTIEALAGQVSAAIEDSAADPVDLVGFSLGAAVCAAVGATRPALVRRLVLVAGWSRADDPYVRNMMSVWRRTADLDAETFGRFATITAFSPTFLQNLGAEEVEKLIFNTEPTPGTLRQIDLNLCLDVRDLLRRIEAETLVIGCSQDRMIPVSKSRELHAAIPGSEYAEIDSGHVVLYERPADFARLVREFLHRP
jgi:pimeloyl-ACP methyl ester carboxylesterase